MTRGFDSKSPALPALQGARVLAVLEAVKTAAAHAGQNQKTASALNTRQNAELDAVHDAQLKLGARGRDLRNSLQLVRESLDRAKLTALNAGLEGARLGEPVGKALVMMGDEVRNLLARGIDALEEHAALLAEVDRERERAAADLAHLGEGAAKLSRELGQAEQKTQLTSALLAELGTDLNEAFGSDTEAARLLASSAGQVNALADSLLALSERSPIGVEALRELLEPLLVLVAPRDLERDR